MANTNDEVFGIGEASRLTDVGAETLVHWDRIGHLPPSLRLGPRGERGYKRNDLLAIVVMRLLRPYARDLSILAPAVKVIRNGMPREPFRESLPDGTERVTGIIPPLDLWNLPPTARLIIDRTTGKPYCALFHPPSGTLTMSLDESLVSVPFILNMSEIVKQLEERIAALRCAAVAA
jgi:hypothetical protein